MKKISQISSRTSHRTFAYKDRSRPELKEITATKARERSPVSICEKPKRNGDERKRRFSSVRRLRNVYNTAFFRCESQNPLRISARVAKRNDKRNTVSGGDFRKFDSNENKSVRMIF